ncbi:MAG: prephenate dehydrogenase/arogenate dehydrogenase family protein, partial [Verrucomicrobiota bacterium]
SFATSAAQAVSDADLVLVAAAVAETGAILAAIRPHLKPGAVVTDAGSTKSDVVAAARVALGSQIACFVPGHPIAGREQNGPDAAIADLYVGKKVVLAALPENAAADVERVALAWRLCGAVIHALSAEEHDRVFAAVSHLPHLLAYALVDDIARKPHADLLFQYAASGFRDFTRIAGSSPEMWRDITLANQKNISRVLGVFIEGLEEFRHTLDQGDAKAIEEFFQTAKKRRDAWRADDETTSAKGLARTAKGAKS